MLKKEFGNGKKGVGNEKLKDGKLEVCLQLAIVINNWL